MNVTVFPTSESLILFLKTVVTKLTNDTVLYMLHFFGNIIDHLERILYIITPKILIVGNTICFPFYIPYDEEMSRKYSLLDFKEDEFDVNNFKLPINKTASSHYSQI